MTRKIPKTDPRIEAIQASASSLRRIKAEAKTRVDGEEHPSAKDKAILRRVEALLTLNRTRSLAAAARKADMSARAVGFLAGRFLEGRNIGAAPLAILEGKPRGASPGAEGEADQNTLAERVRRKLLEYAEQSAGPRDDWRYGRPVEIVRNFFREREADFGPGEEDLVSASESTVRRAIQKTPWRHKIGRDDFDLLLRAQAAKAQPGAAIYVRRWWRSQAEVNAARRRAEQANDAEEENS